MPLIYGIKTVAQTKTQQLIVQGSWPSAGVCQ